MSTTKSPELQLTDERVREMVSDAANGQDRGPYSLRVNARSAVMLGTELLAARARIAELERSNGSRCTYAGYDAGGAFVRCILPDGHAPSQSPNNPDGHEYAPAEQKPGERVTVEPAGLVAVVIELKSRLADLERTAIEQAGALLRVGDCMRETDARVSELERSLTDEQRAVWQARATAWQCKACGAQHPATALQLTCSTCNARRLPYEPPAVDESAAADRSVYEHDGPNHRARGEKVSRR